MIPSARVKGRGSRPGPSVRQQGSVTVEAAGLVLPLLLFLLMLLSCLGLVHGQFLLTATARDAARAASLQPTLSDARSAAALVVAREAPGATPVVTLEGEYVTVQVSGGIRILGLPGRVHLTSSSTMLLEQPW